jgi:hypothetical protein
VLISQQNKLHNYEPWAVESRAWVQTKFDSRSTDQVSALNASATAAFETLSRRFDAQQEKANVTDGKIAALETTVRTMSSNMASLVRLLQERDNPPPAGNPPAAAAAPAAQEQPQEAQEGKYFSFRFFLSFILLTTLLLL